jgi:hypothetical protein
MGRTLSINEAWPPRPEDRPSLRTTAAVNQPLHNPLLRGHADLLAPGAEIFGPPSWLMNRARPWTTPGSQVIPPELEPAVQRGATRG